MAAQLAWTLVMVPPLAGGWIEIGSTCGCSGSDIVPPLAGGWIEILAQQLAAAEALGPTPCGWVD